MVTRHRLFASLQAVFLWAAALALAAAMPAPAAAQQPDSARSALAWLKGQQQPDGSFPGFGAGSTVDALLAIVAAGEDPASYSAGGKSPLDFLQSKAAELSANPGGAGKLAVAVEAAGLDPRSFGGVDVVRGIESTYDAKGQYGKDAIGHAFGMLGLQAAGAPVPQAAVDYLKGVQGPEGGWSFTGDTAPKMADTNTTAVAVQALLAQGEPADSPAMQRALAYLRSQQNPDGGFPYQQGGEFGSDSDVNSTAYVAQALLALGQSADEPVRFITSMQNPSGAIRWKASEPADNPGATYQAVPALLGATFTSMVRAVGGPTTGQGDKLPPGGEPSPLPIVLLTGGLLALGAGLVARSRRASAYETHES